MSLECHSLTKLAMLFLLTSCYSPVYTWLLTAWRQHRGRSGVHVAVGKVNQSVTCPEMQIRSFHFESLLCETLKW